MASLIGGTLKDYKAFIIFLKKNKQDFTTKVGNFSATIDYEGLKYRFTNTNRDFSIFAAVANLKKDLKPHLENFKVDRKNLQYYFLKSDFISYEGEFYNLDIKRAYPTTLYNTGLLREKTIENIEKLKKADKLAVCGMLAYNPDIFDFENGKVIAHKKLSDNPKHVDFSHCFFYCVKKIQDLMLEIINEISGEYFFTWVDGIFFPKNDILKSKIVDIIRKNGYECSFDLCNNLQTEIKEHCLNVEYSKGEEIKRLSFPSQLARNKKKYDLFQEILKEENEEKFLEDLNKNFVLDKNGNIIF